MTNPPVKLALCTDLVNLPQEYQEVYAPQESGCARAPQLLSLPSLLSGLPVRLVDRAICETDKSMRQLIPYIVIIDDYNKVYCYSRGGAGGEGRLIGNLSIGLGGHVDEAPRDGETLQSLLYREAERELNEEAGLGHGSISFVHMIADTDDVGCVHCGILGYRRVTHDERANLSPEAGCIEKGEWLTLEQLTATDVYARLEGWSKLAVKWLEVKLA